MASQVVVFVGPARSGKTQELLRHYRVALESACQDGFDRTIWLAPNGRTASGVREQLIREGLSVCLRPGIITFDDLTTQILAASNARPKRLNSVLQRELLRRVVAQALASGTLAFYADAARRPGFVQLLAEHFAELKRRDIRPDANMVSPRSSAQQVNELARLYADYETLLATHGLVDHESALWAARDALAENASGRFRNLELVVVDGFTDFTRTEHDILRRLSEVAKQLLISLPDDGGDEMLAATQSDSGADRAPAARAAPCAASRPMQNPRRPDLFAKTAATLSELQRQFPNLDVRRLAARPLTCPAIDYLARHIFSHPKHIPAPAASVRDSLPQLEIVESAGAQDEIVQIARRIKSLLIGSRRPGSGHSAALSPQSPARPGDILVVFRSLADAAPRIREVFARFGIPFYLGADQPIATASVVRTLVDLLVLEQEDWRFQRVISIITNNSLTALAGDSRRAADWLVRDLQIAAGRSALLDRAQLLAAETSAPDERSEYLQRRCAAASAALPVLLHLASSLSELPGKAAPSEWCEALSRLGAKLGLWPFMDDAPKLRTGHFSDPSQGADADALNATDLAAWQSIVAQLAALERLDGWLGQPPRPLSRQEMLAALRDVATNETLPRGHDDAGRVRILAVQSARNISARHLFLAGMSEQAFPDPERPGRLATDADYRHFERVGRQRSNADALSAPGFTRANAEMLLFYEVLSRADESLTISYPALDDKAQTLPPSPYVVELQRLFETDQNIRIPRTTPQLSPVASEAVPYSFAEWRVQALARAIGKDADRRLLAGLFACQEAMSPAEAIDAGLRVVHARARGESFGPSEGLLTSPAALERLAHRFGPDHVWSASQWESYAACPYKFFLEDILGLEPLGDLTLDIDHRRRGSIVHNVLATFHRKLHDAPAEARAALVGDDARFAAELHGTLQEVIRASGLGRNGIDAALLELDRRQIEKWIAHYRKDYEKYESAWAGFDEPMLPAHFELRFGQARPGDANDDDPHSVNDAYRLDIGGEQVLVTGRIDRIDIGRAGGKTVFNVIDYKSGRRPTLTAEKIESGECLQPALYVMAAQALVFNNEATPLWAGYWSMKNGVTTDKRYSLYCGTNDASTTPEWPALQPRVVQRIRALVHAIRGGQFPVFSSDSDCTSRCEFNTVCRVAQARSAGKTWSPDAAGGLAENKSQSTVDP